MKYFAAQLGVKYMIFFNPLLVMYNQRGVTLINIYFILCYSFFFLEFIESRT